MWITSTFWEIQQSLQFITFMKLANEAARTRNPLAPLEYSQEKIDRTARGDDPVS